jgi:hypothetical protein
VGHIRLGRLPSSKRWSQVVELLRVGGSVAELAAATADAAESEFQSAKGDPALAYVVWLLTQLPLAARSQHFAARLVELGFDAGAEQSALRLVAGFSHAVDRNVVGGASRTDLGELARQAAAESLSSIVGAGTRSLLDSTASQLRTELGRLATRNGFSYLARDFFARTTQKTLEYYISRGLPKQLASGKPVLSIAGQIEFRAALEKHCREAALIIEQFAGGWYSKSNFRGTLTPDSAQAFADYALKKMRDELRARRAVDV